MSEASRARQFARIEAGDTIPDYVPRGRRKPAPRTEDQIRVLRDMSGRGHTPGLKQAVGTDTYLVTPTGAWMKMPVDMSRLPQYPGAWPAHRAACPGQLPRL